MKAEEPKTLRELRDFLNGIEERFLDKPFTLQQENDLHHVHFLELSQEDLFHDPDNLEEGNMSIEDWKEYSPDTDRKKLQLGIPIGFPMFHEDF